MTEDEYLSSLDEAEARVEYVKAHMDADHIDDDLFEREDGSQFVVTQWPYREQDFDRDDVTGQVYPCGWSWTGLQTKEVEL